MSLVSVIMPLYNAEKYLPEALQSVLKQTYRDFELLCINDCSDDGTDMILLDYGNRDERIRIFNNHRRLGAAISRNKGLEAARGKYVLFLDGDDIFEEELLEKAVEAMEQYGTEIVIFESMPVPDSEIYEKRTRRRAKNFINSYCKVPFTLKNVDFTECISWTSSPCDKLFKRRFLENYQLEFQDISSCNDVYFVKLALMCAEKIIWLDDRRIMVYAREHSEPSRISNNRDPVCIYYAMKQLAEGLKRRDMFAIYVRMFYAMCASYFMGVMGRKIDEECKKKFYEFMKRKGIAACIGWGQEYYETIDPYDQYLLHRFQSSSFVPNWNDTVQTRFQFYLEKNGELVQKFAETKLKEKKRIIVWGIGINGRVLVEYLVKYLIPLSAIVDKDTCKHGMSVNGYYVSKPSDCYGKMEVIFVTSRQLLWEVQDITEDMGVEKINVFDLLVKEEI